MESIMKNEISLEFLLKILTLTSNISYMDIWWRTDGNYAPVSIFVNCNNVFDPGLADCECITPENIGLFEEASNDIRAITDLADEYIPMLFCARIRGKRPMDSMYPENEALWPLFNACGPYTFYPDRDSTPPFVPRPEDVGQTHQSWWRRLIEYIRDIIDNVCCGVYDGFYWVKDRL